MPQLGDVGKPEASKGKKLLSMLKGKGEQSTTLEPAAALVGAACSLCRLCAASHLSCTRLQVPSEGLSLLHLGSDHASMQLQRGSLQPTPPGAYGPVHHASVGRQPCMSPSPSSMQISDAQVMGCMHRTRPSRIYCWAKVLRKGQGACVRPP